MATIRFIIVALSFLLLSSCKSYLGTYCTAPDLTAWCYTFEKNNRFKYDFGSCLGSDFGSGTYYIVKDTIIFNFIKTEVKRGSFDVELVENLGNEIALNLTVVDSATKKPIVFYSAALYENEVLIGGTEGDIDGEASVKRPFNGNPIILKIEYFEQYPVTIELNEPGAYSINIEMVSGAPKIIPSQEWIFRIEKMDENEILLGNFENEELQKTLNRKKPRKSF